MFEFDTERPSKSSRMLRALALVVLVLVLIALGLFSTLYWLLPVHWHDYSQTRLSAAVALAIVMAATTVNLLLRWFRWHFLLRRLDLLLKTRQSFRVFVITLPLLVIPFCLGDLLRSYFVGNRGIGTRRTIASAWIIERLADTLALLFLMLLAENRIALAMLTLLGQIMVGRVMIANLRSRGTPHSTALVSPGLLAVILAVSSVVAWALPCLAFALTLLLVADVWLLQPATEAFASGTFLGGLSGIPLGTGVVGSTAIVILTKFGVPEQAAAVSVLVMRVGTVWYAVGAGLAFVLFQLRHRGRAQPADVGAHFDELAVDYSAELPAYLRERLVIRKVDVMQCQTGPLTGQVGLDIGCGHGWYAAEMINRGATMFGVDVSLGQVTEARKYASKEGLALPTYVASAAALPFPDDTFDFIYAINVFHHMLDPHVRERAFEEVVRVLKPGGKFFLNEMNIDNPLFRFYMSYVFPLINSIDEGNEVWLRFSELPTLPGAKWDPHVEYFTFLPDFISSSIWRALRPLEIRLERSHRLRRFSAHYVAILSKAMGVAQQKTLTHSFDS